MLTLQRRYSDAVVSLIGSYISLDWLALDKLFTRVLASSTLWASPPLHVLQMRHKLELQSSHER